MITLREDRWWVQPLVTFSVLFAFVVYVTWAAFQNKNYYVGAAEHRDLLSPLYSPCIADSCVPGALAPRPAQLVELLPRAPDPDHPGRLPGHLLLLPPQLLPRVLVVAAVLRGPGPPHARTAARRGSRSCSRTRTGTSSTSPSSSTSSSPTTRSSPSRCPASASACPSARSCSSSTPRCCGSTRSAATPAATCAAAHVRKFSDHPAPPAALEVHDAAQRPAHADRLGEPHLRRAHRRLRPARRERRDHRLQAPLGGGPDPRDRAPRLRRARRRRGRRGAARRDRVDATRAAHRDRDQVAARQGPHRHGRGRRRRRHGQRLPRGQLAGALPRHDARRQDAQQLPHGRAARPGVARPRPRARVVGCAVRPHRRRPDPAARLRRPPLREARPRRGPHRARDDPHAPAEGGLARRRRRDGVQGAAPRSPTPTARSRAASPTTARPASSSRSRAPAVVLATGGVGKSWKYTSNSWESTGDGHALALWAGAQLIDMEAIQFHPTGHGLAAQRAGPARHRGRPRRRRRAAQLRAASGSCSTTSPTCSAPRPPTPRRRPTAGTTTTRGPAPPELLPRDEVARAINTEVKAGRGTPHGGVYLDIASRRSAGVHPAPPALDVPPVHGARRRRHHDDADGDRPDVPLHHGRRPRGGRHRGDQRAGAVRRGRGRGRHARLEPPRRQLAVSDLLVFGRRAGVGASDYVEAGAKPAGRSTPPSVDAAIDEATAPLAREDGREPLRRPARPPRDDAGQRRDHPHRRRARPRRSRALDELAERVANLAVQRRPRVQPGLEPRHRPAEHAHGLAVHDARGDQPQGEPRRAHPRGLPDARRRARQGQLRALPAERRRATARRSRPCPSRSSR